MMNGTGMLAEIRKEIQKNKNPQKARFLQRFFKTGKGEYAEGDVFLGLTVPQSRAIAKKFKDLKIKDLTALLKSKFHEERLIALLILVQRFKKADENEREKLHKFYLKHTKYINNWDLVDTSAEILVGAFLFTKKRTLLYKLARSKNIWERRIAIIATFYFIKNGETKDTVKIAKVLLSDRHDLIHKASGWMLREMGKRVDETELKKFLDENAAKMPRTMLRYSIERFPSKDRKRYLNFK